MSHETGATEQFERQERSLWMPGIHETLTDAPPPKTSLAGDQVLDLIWKKHVFKGL